MLREFDMEAVSDGRLYTANDLVKADCGGCQGCSECCRNEGDTIILDPYDVYWLCRGLQTDFNSLLSGGYVALQVVDGLIMPNLNLDEARGCPFLNREGRCSIHAFRPGFCRLFPLGRIYDGDSFRYFLQVQECPKPKTKVKIKKWLGIQNLPAYEKYVSDWHHYRKGLEEKVEAEPDRMKEVSLKLLHKFFASPYDLTRDFYVQFYGRAGENLEG